MDPRPAAPPIDPWTGAAVRARREPAAVLALVFAIASVFAWFVPAVFAIFLAPAAKRSIAVSGGARSGRNLAIAAQVIAWCSLMIASGVLALLCFA